MNSVRSRRAIYASLITLFCLYCLAKWKVRNIAPALDFDTHAPQFSSCEQLQQYAFNLPYTRFVPFEQSIQEIEHPSWVDEWISKGVYNANRNGPVKLSPIDFVYTWVNGSDADFVRQRQLASQRSRLNTGDYFSKQENRFREWDELRYSIRSIYQNIPKAVRGKIYLIVSETNVLDDRRPLVPNWLKAKIDRGIVQIVTHRDLFPAKHEPCLPTFNSLSIESQLGRLSDLKSDVFSYMNDDMFYIKPASASDIYTDLYGPTMFLMNLWRDVKPMPGQADLNKFGDHSMTEYAAWLLNERFGPRKRRHVGHMQKYFSARNFAEMQLSFPQEAYLSPSYAFRNEGLQAAMSTMLAYHYTIERHREALLWSYVELKIDANGDKYLDLNERQAMKADWDSAMSFSSKRSDPRPVLSQAKVEMSKAGLETFRIFNTPLWSSNDGSLYQNDLDVSQCRPLGNYSFDRCFGADFADDSGPYRNREHYVSLLLDKIGRQMPECGDCLLSTVLSTTERGLEPLLPTAGVKRQMAIKALYRYKYLAGRYDSSFYMMTSVKVAEEILLKKYVQNHHHLAANNNSATMHWSLMCLNDDVGTTDPTQLDTIGRAYQTFFNTFFPTPSPLELQNSMTSLKV